MTYTIYRVLPGDTLNKIAGSYGLSLSELLEINPQIENADFIQVGEPINVPSQSASDIEVSEDIPPWYAIAKQEMATGVQEVPGSTLNPRIIEYHQAPPR